MKEQKTSKVETLHYHHYAKDKYETDIVRAIPGHAEMHEEIKKELAKQLGDRNITALELGIGTGLTAEPILRNFNVAKFTGIDFSSAMLEGAAERLKQYKPELICADYAECAFPQNLDLVISVISIHHQPTDEAKRKLFRKIYASLKPGGVFIFGDLVTWKDEKIAALNEARHFHHLVENATDENTLTEWAHHYKFVNCLAPLENQIKWLEEVGFKTKIAFSKFNTALVVAVKQKQKITELI